MTRNACPVRPNPPALARATGSRPRRVRVGTRFSASTVRLSRSSPRLASQRDRTREVIADALSNAQRGRSGGRHSGRACWRYRRAAAGLDEIARPAADARLAPHPDAAPHVLVADPDPSGGDFGLGVVLSVARMPARCRSGVLLFRSHLHDRWLRRSGAGEAVAAARTDRGLDGHPQVRLVHGLLLRCHELHLSIRAGPPSAS